MCREQSRCCIGPKRGDFAFESLTLILGILWERGKCCKGVQISGGSKRLDLLVGVCASMKISNERVG